MLPTSLMSFLIKYSYCLKLIMRIRVSKCLELPSIQFGWWILNCTRCTWNTDGIFLQKKYCFLGFLLLPDMKIYKCKRIFLKPELTIVKNLLHQPSSKQLKDLKHWLHQHRVKLSLGFALKKLVSWVFFLLPDIKIRKCKRIFLRPELPIVYCISQAVSKWMIWNIDCISTE